MTHEDLAHVIAVLIFFMMGLAVYFMPTIIALARRHRQVDPISILNIFFGWTIIGWVICLALAMSTDVYPKHK